MSTASGEELNQINTEADVHENQDKQNVDLDDRIIESANVLLGSLIDLLGEDPRKTSAKATKEDVIISSPFLKFTAIVDTVPTEQDAKEWREVYLSKKKTIQTLFEQSLGGLADATQERVEAIKAELTDTAKGLIKSGVIYSFARSLTNPGAGKLVEQGLIRSLKNVVEAARLCFEAIEEHSVLEQDDSDLSDEEFPDYSRFFAEKRKEQKERFAEKKSAAKAAKMAARSATIAASTPKPALKQRVIDPMLQNVNRNRRSDHMSGNIRFLSPEPVTTNTEQESDEHSLRMSDVNQLIQAQGVEMNRLGQMMETLLQNQTKFDHCQSQDEDKKNVTVFNNPKQFFQTGEHMSAEFLTTLPDDFATAPSEDGSNFTMPDKSKTIMSILTGEADYDIWKASYIRNVYRYKIDISTKVICLKESVDKKNPEILRIVQNVKPDAYGFRSIVQQFHTKYGSKEAYGRKLYSALMAYPPVGMSNSDSLVSFQSDLWDFIQNEYREGRGNDLDVESNNLYQSLASKLTFSARENLVMYCRMHRKSHCTLTLLQWCIEMVDSLTKGACLIGQKKSIGQEANPSQKKIVKHATAKESFDRADQATETFLYNASENFEYIPNKECDVFGDESEKNQQYVNVAASNSLPCPICQRPHHLSKCPDFIRRDPRGRREIIVEMYYCYNCLNRGHLTYACQSSQRCEVCGLKHHTLLHIDAPTTSKNFSNVKRLASRFESEQQKQKTGKNITSAKANLCTEEQTEKCDETEEETSQEETTFAVKIKDKVKIGLRTFPVIVENPVSKKTLRINAMLDDGSTCTLLDESVAKALKLKLKPSANPISICGIGGIEAGSTNQLADFTIRSTNGSHKGSMTASVFKDPCQGLRPSFWLDHQILEDLEFDEPEPDNVKLLIGCNYQEYHVSLTADRAGTDNQPAARKTLLGWTAIGHMSSAGIQKQEELKQQQDQDTDKNSNKSFIYENTLLVSCAPIKIFPDSAGDAKLEDILRKQSELYRLDDDFEETVPKLTDEEQFALDTLNNSVRLVDVGNGKKQYEISTLWKETDPDFLSNHNYAEKRLLSTVKNKLADPECYKKYDDIIKGWLKSNYIEETQNEMGKQQFFLPHFPVIRQDKTTTKIRPVMDAAAKCKGPNGPKCLNDGLLEGPKLIQPVPDVLMRFRHNRVAVIGDLKEMFLQVVLPEKDRNFHKFIWFDDNGNKKYYRFRVHCFGNRSSPAVAIFAIKHHAELHRDAFPRAVETVLQSTIVDDNCDSVESTEEGLKLIQDLKTLYSTAGMEIRKWASNDVEIMSNLPDEDKAANVVFSYDFEPDSKMPKIKALGIIWLAEPDKLTFLAEFNLNQTWTKRTVLSSYSKLFDPIGLIAPVAITARIVTQACWRHGLGWDQVLPEAIQKKWKIWVDALEDLPQLRIDRSVKPSRGKILSEEIHIFCDGSQHAYGAVAYNVCHMEDKSVYSNIILAKARVAPLKGETPNKLELRGAVLAATVAKVIKRVLRVQHDQIHFWTDSKNVLAWLHTKKWLINFVQNRVTMIKYVSDLEQWRWLPTEYNPADELSRGSTVTQLLHNERWWRGPDFIRQNHRFDWPKQPSRYDNHVLDVINEKVIGVPFDGTANNGKDDKKTAKDQSDERVTTCHSEEDENIITRFSSWKRFVKVCCWILRWKSITKLERTHVKPMKDSKSKKSDKPLPYVTYIKYKPSLNDSVNVIGAAEFIEVETKLIALYQRKSFTDTFEQLKKGSNKIVSVKNHIYKLNPRLEQDGLLHVDGRLRNIAALGQAARPILLPKKQHITKLIIMHYHIDVCCHYGGTNYLLSRVQERFWPVNGFKECQRIVTSCTRCQILKKKAKRQQMATLPEFRIPSIDMSKSDQVQALVPYMHTGLDYGGPLVTRQGRAKARQKRWFCLLTCLQCRAVHIEMVYNLTTESFLQAFERFIARNCKPKHIYMDNQTTFVRAEAEIHSWMNEHAAELKHRALRKFSSIEFHFIPPASPNYGGAWESMIKQTKRCIYDKVKDGILTDEELLTVLTTVEGLLNSRPLMNVSSDPEDLRVLTPAHFLIRGTYESIAPVPKSWSEKQRYLFVQDLVSSMWERLLKEVIPKKNKFPKNVKKVDEVKVGDAVIMRNERDRDRSWPVAIITKILPSHDDIVRRCEVRFNNKTYIRSSNDFVKLESIKW